MYVRRCVSPAKVVKIFNKPFFSEASYPQPRLEIPVLCKAFIAEEDNSIGAYCTSTYCIDSQLFPFWDKVLCEVICTINI